MEDKVEATIIEEAISPLARSEQWLAQARARVTDLAAQYRVPEEILTDKDFKDAKASRTAVRKDAKELDDERKRMTRAMDVALKRFRADVKGVLEPLTELDAAYKEALDAYEERWGRQRRRDLEEAYEEYAPDLMELVPLDRLISRYGSERGKGWLNRSTNVEAAKADMRAAMTPSRRASRRSRGAWRRRTSRSPRPTSSRRSTSGRRSRPRRPARTSASGCGASRRSERPARRHTAGP